MPRIAHTATTKIGIPYWMDRVLEEHAKASSEYSSEAVHDLRVSLRRCILIADFMETLDETSDWKAMRKAAKAVFHALGDLRDAQVLAEWIQKLGSPELPAPAALVQSLKEKAEKAQSEAGRAIRAFDRKQWREWARTLGKHFQHVAANHSACESLVEEALEQVEDLHRRAQKIRSLVAYHRLRIALKKFRYAVENFLPSLVPGWEADLKSVQDVLGELHDLNVLRQEIAKSKSVMDEAARAAWKKKLQEECGARVRKYREMMAGKSSPRRAWREGLPGERQLRATGLARLSEWAWFLTPDIAQVRRTARLALQLYDGLANHGLAGRDSNVDERFILQSAALLQEVGHSHHKRPHHKEAYRMIRRLSPPPGWTKKDLDLVALVARFHRRALPRTDHRLLKSYEYPVRHALVLLAAVLRFANALGAKPYRAIRHLDVEECSGVLVVRAGGFSEQAPLDPKLAEARRLLEFTCQKSLHILSPGTRMIGPRQQSAPARIHAA